MTICIYIANYQIFKKYLKSDFPKHTSNNITNSHVSVAIRLVDVIAAFKFFPGIVGKKDDPTVSIVCLIFFFYVSYLKN